MKAKNLVGKKEVSVLFEPEKDTRQHLLLGKKEPFTYNEVEFLEVENEYDRPTGKFEVLFSSKDGNTFIVNPETDIITLN